MRYGSCTFEEIARLAADGAVAVLPMGCTEQQGPHLPVDFDSWFAEQLTVAAAERAGADHRAVVLVLPVIPVGPASEHRSFGAGFLDLPWPVHDALVTAILDSLAAQGFRDVVVWRGCGGHDLRQAVAAFAESRPSVRVHLPEPPFHQFWCAEADPAIPSGHADSFTTSIMLARRPELVHLDRVPPPSRTPDWQDPGLDFGAYSDSGTIGDARHGSAELGERLWETAVAWMSRYLATIADNSNRAKPSNP